MPQRTQITLPSEDHQRARARAAEMGVSLAEYMRDLVARDLNCGAAPRSSPEDLFDLGSSAGADVASEKDTYVGEAVRAGRVRGGGTA